MLHFEEYYQDILWYFPLSHWNAEFPPCLSTWQKRAKEWYAILLFAICIKSGKYALDRSSNVAELRGAKTKYVEVDEVKRIPFREDCENRPFTIPTRYPLISKPHSWVVAYMHGSLINITWRNLWGRRQISESMTSTTRTQHWDRTTLPNGT